MKAALWIRVSTVEQTTANQRRVLQRLCAKRGWEVVQTFDLTASAYKGDQDAMLTDMLAAASRGEFGTLVCWALDRLERRGGELTVTLLGQLSDRQVVVVSTQEPWVEDMRDPMTRKFLVYVMGWLAEGESRRRSERTLAGQARAKAEGKHIGRPAGAKDKGSRKTAGYLYREAVRREANKSLAVEATK